MNITLSELSAAYNQGSNPDVRKCGCKGRGWYLTDYDVYVECSCHPGRVHPESLEYGGTFAELRVVNRNGKPVHVRGESVPCLYQNVTRARTEARSIQDKVARYGWKVTLQWKRFLDFTPPTPAQEPPEYTEIPEPTERAYWGCD